MSVSTYPEFITELSPVYCCLVLILFQSISFVLKSGRSVFIYLKPKTFVHLCKVFVQATRAGMDQQELPLVSKGEEEQDFSPSPSTSSRFKLNVIYDPANLVTNRQTDKQGDSRSWMLQNLTICKTFARQKINRFKDKRKWMLGNSGEVN